MNAYYLWIARTEASLFRDCRWNGFPFVVKNRWLARISVEMPVDAAIPQPEQSTVLYIVRNHHWYKSQKVSLQLLLAYRQAIWGDGTGFHTKKQAFDAAWRYLEKIGCADRWSTGRKDLKGEYLWTRENLAAPPLPTVSRCTGQKKPDSMS